MSKDGSGVYAFGMRRFRTSFAATVMSIGVSMVSCHRESSSEHPLSATNGARPMSGDAGDEDDSGMFEIAVPCVDTLEALYGDSEPLTLDRGRIVRCAPDGHFTKDELETLARSSGYEGRPFRSGANAFHVVFLTERAPLEAGGSEPSAARPGYSSALVLIPDAPKDAALPVVVAAHGSVWGSCIPSQTVLEAPNGLAPLLLPLAGDGFAVIAPDYAGFANYRAPGNPPPAYASSEDEGRSVLDAARALRNLIPRGVSDKVVLVGHSQGGHAVLSALALSGTYGAGGTMAGVVAYAPLWLNQASWGGMLLLPSLFPIASNLQSVAAGLWYHYSHGELLDGAGHGTDVFASALRERVKNVFDNLCEMCDWTQLSALGTTVADLYDPDFAQAIGASAGLGQPCPADANHQGLCEKWMKRYAADRPHLMGLSATVPILAVYGTADTLLPPERMRCGFDRLRADGANMQVCLVPGADHMSILAARGSYVTDWIAAQTLGSAPPPSCDIDETGLVADSGEPIACAVPPPND